MFEEGIDYRKSIEGGKPSLTMQTRERPFGITLIISFQIFGTVLFLILLSVEPYLFKGPVFKIYLLYAIIIIPVVSFLTYGLLRGSEWARYYSRLYQVIEVVAAILQFSFLGIIIPLFLFYYLNRPNVLQYFDIDRKFNFKSKILVIATLVYIAILNSYMAIYANPLIRNTLHL